MHIAKEKYNFAPQSYVDAVRFVAERLGLTCVDDLVALVRLRNIVIHRYWIVDDYKIYISVKNNFKCIAKLVEAIKKIGG
ncbi:MAG: HepT-like ribonuclease domain-containing protein [Candidatus Asgardarchaeia archaeon]